MRGFGVCSFWQNRKKINFDDLVMSLSKVDKFKTKKYSEFYDMYIYAHKKVC